MKAATQFVFSLLVWPIAASAEASPWQAWEHYLHQRCPNNHVEWVEDGGYDELLGAFEATLPLRAREEISRIIDYDHRCAAETVGFSCEMGMSLYAFRRLGILKRFVDFGCAHVKCEDVASCSEFPGRSGTSNTPSETATK
jgi:hypothetical protein